MRGKTSNDRIRNEMFREGKIKNLIELEEKRLQ